MSLVIFATTTPTRPHANDHTIGSFNGYMNGANRLIFLLVRACYTSNTHTEVRLQPLAYSVSHSTRRFFADCAKLLNGLMWHSHVFFELRTIRYDAANKVLGTACYIGQSTG